MNLLPLCSTAVKRSVAPFQKFVMCHMTKGAFVLYPDNVFAENIREYRLAFETATSTWHCGAVTREIEKFVPGVIVTEFVEPTYSNKRGEPKFVVPVCDSSLNSPA